jgi:hypothetical protein
MRIWVVIAVMVARVAVVHAQSSETATYAVELTGAWEADAIAAALRADLADDVLRAPRSGVAAELVVRGEVAEGELRYEITRVGGAPVRGVIELAGDRDAGTSAMDRAQLAGVLRDRLHRIVRPHDAAEPGLPAELPEPGDAGGALFALAVLAGVLAIPLVAAVRLRVRRTRGARRVVAALVAIAGVGYGLAVHGARVPELGGGVMLAGGLAWGAFAAVTLPVALPPLFGLHRVEHGELTTILGAWLALAAQRVLAVAAVYVPIGVVVWLACDALGVPAELALAVVLPVVALALRLAWRAVVEVIAARLDDALVDTSDATAAAWHAQVRAYFVGYLHRANLEVDLATLDRMRFLPGHGSEVAVYGGGLAETRVVIPRVMLEHALAPYGRPHDYAMPRVSTLHWTHWNAGVVMPTEAGAKLASREDRKPHQTVEEGEHERIALGEPPTFSGIIEPQALDPRTSYRPDEDPLWLDWDPGEEFDGTDAGDKDYLFGVLVHALGMRQRHEDPAATVALALRRSSRLGFVARVLAPLQRLAARSSARLGDIHAVLGGARHHLVQYLAWQLWHREDLTTARAYVPVLEQSSRRIMAALASDAAGTAGGADLRRRLERLRVFTAGAPQAARRRGRLAIGAIAAVAVIAAVVQAVLYHPGYEARMAAEHERLDDGRRR